MGAVQLLHYFKHEKLPVGVILVAAALLGLMVKQTRLQFVFYEWVFGLPCQSVNWCLVLNKPNAVMD